MHGNIGLSKTVNLPAKLKLCVTSRVMLTDNIKVSDRLINSSTGTVKNLNRRSKPFFSTIYLKLDGSKAGNSLKDRKLFGELKECVPMTARAKSLPLKKGKSAVITKKTIYVLFGQATTTHKCQGSPVAYMQGDLNQDTGKKTVTVKSYQQPIFQDQFYTLISPAKSLDKVLLLNFEPEDIKINEVFKRRWSE